MALLATDKRFGAPRTSIPCRDGSKTNLTGAEEVSFSKLSVNGTTARSIKQQRNMITVVMAREREKE